MVMEKKKEGMKGMGDKNEIAERKGWEEMGKGEVAISPFLSCGVCLGILRCPMDGCPCCAVSA